MDVIKQRFREYKAGSEETYDNKVKYLYDLIQKDSEQSIAKESEINGLKAQNQSLDQKLKVLQRESEELLNK